MAGFVGSPRSIFSDGRVASAWISSVSSSLTVPMATLMAPVPISMQLYGSMRGFMNSPVPCLRPRSDAATTRI